jgi:hypothetical protein
LPGKDLRRRASPPNGPSTFGRLGPGIASLTLRVGVRERRF